MYVQKRPRDLLTNPLVENGILQVSLSSLPCRGERWFTAAPARATETAKSNLSLKNAVRPFSIAVEHTAPPPSGFKQQN